ncbi:MAG: right-handed parallel beta-helix repeat-containing protein, partial [Candidatus Heimdallarchaeota archaeon]|nr:right-handed parallel beta-helix repeat-containing protein [Candidatus Heimdallarchaeota archaeon]
MITNNYISQSSFIGIRVEEESGGTTIRANYCENNSKAIEVSGSYRTLIEKNVCKFSEYTGIYIVGSGYSNILDNNLTSSGFNWYVNQNLEYDLTMSFENNYVNDKPFVFLTNLTNQTLSSNDFGQLFLMNCSDITIEDLDIRDTSTALALAFCSNSTIRNSNFSENTVSGISLDYSTDIV